MAAYHARTQFSGSQDGIFLAVGLEYAVPEGQRAGGSPCAFVLLRVACRKSLRQRADHSRTILTKEAVVERLGCVIERLVWPACCWLVCYMLANKNEHAVWGSSPRVVGPRKLPETRSSG